MNKIDEFALQSQKEYGDFNGSIAALDYRKFAELIVQECMAVNAEFMGHRIGEIDLDMVYKEHFGIK